LVIRCKEALSPSEINSSTIKAGRLLLQEASESLCRKLKPDLDNLLSEITGLRLFDIRVGFFLERRERIYLFTMNETVKCQSEQFGRSS
jgi:uncharacterized protein YbcI